MNIELDPLAYVKHYTFSSPRSKVSRTNILLWQSHGEQEWGADYRRRRARRSLLANICGDFGPLDPIFNKHWTAEFYGWVT